MLGFGLWLAATMFLGWIFGLLGRAPDPVKCALVLAAWFAFSGGLLVLRDLRRVGK
jgi:hypothetical protein